MLGLLIFSAYLRVWLKPVASVFAGDWSLRVHGLGYPHGIADPVGGRKALIRKNLRMGCAHFVPIALVPENDVAPSKHPLRYYPFGFINSWKSA